MRGKVARMLRKQSELTGIRYKSLKRLWNSDDVSQKMKEKWRIVIGNQAKEVAAQDEIDRIKAEREEASEPNHSQP